MIVIVGTIDLLHPGERDECVARSVPVQLATRHKEPGCIGYAFCADPSVATRIQICEVWADAKCLDAHFHHPNFTGMLEILRDYEQGSPQIRKYHVDAEAPVLSAVGVPTAAFETLS
jgi:quinol monooxygenase YgiN